MEKNFSYNLNLEDYAQLCHMSLSNFKKTFKKYYNTTPAAWLKERKLELACFRIINSDQRINEISFDCGFEDVSHFIRSFKQKHGLTPFQYRQKHFETSLAGI
jgi:AraC-like DNA-binding protein